jgi:DNA polymerase III subunit gamma/tau
VLIVLCIICAKIEVYYQRLGRSTNMPEQALYLKWRPAAFDEMVGQEHIVRTLRNALKTGRIRHAYLFSGPRGTGKTTTARLLAKAVNCTAADVDQRPCNQCSTCVAVNEGRFLDLIEIDAATHTSVDDVRDLRDKIAFAPTEGRYKVYIIDEVHRFSGSAFDALLKTLEEPPDHAIFVLATTEIDKVPQTIKSRSLQFEFRRLSLVEVADRLQEIAENEGINIERAALELIARQGTGSARDSISLLDQVVSDPTERITLEVAQRILGTASVVAVRELAAAVIAGDVSAGIHTVNQAIDTGSDPKQLGQQVVEHLRAVLLAQTASADLIVASNEERQLYTEQAKQIDRASLLRAIRAFNEAVTQYRGGWQPQLMLELALVESVRGGETVRAEASPAGTTAAPARGFDPTHGEDLHSLVQQLVAQEMSKRGMKAVVSADPDLPEPQGVMLPTGTAPTLEMVKAGWGDMLRHLFIINKSAPDLVQTFRPLRVDGHKIVLATDDAIAHQKFQPSDVNGGKRVRAVEMAFEKQHQARVSVEVILVDDLNTMSQQTEHDDPIIKFAVEELGGQVKSRKSKKKES